MRTFCCPAFMHCAFIDGSEDCLVDHQHKNSATTAPMVCVLWADEWVI